MGSRSDELEQKEYQTKGVDLKVGLASSFFGHEKPLWVMIVTISDILNGKGSLQFKDQQRKVTEANPVKCVAHPIPTKPTQSSQRKLLEKTNRDM